MAKVLILLICFLFLNSIFADFRHFDRNQNKDSEIDIFYRKLARDLRSSSNNLESVMQNLATSLGRHQLEDLYRMNPSLKKIIEFDISLKFESKSKTTPQAKSSKTKDDLNEENEKKQKNKLVEEDVKKAESITYLKIQPDNYFGKIDVEYKNKYFLSNLNYSIAGNEIDIQFSRKILGAIGTIEYNTRSDSIKTSVRKNMSKDLRVNISTITNIGSKRAFAGINLRYGF